MNILVNGSSISRGPNSWPYLVQEYFNANLINLSLAGAGNTYMHEATISELARRDYDLVIIQWTTHQRVDYKVKNINLFDGTIYTSKYQSEHNDWPKKIIWPINDQDYVEKDWIFGCGYAVNNDRHEHLQRAFEDFYNYTGASEQHYHTLMKIISLQSYLKVKGIPYVFCFGRPFKLFDRFDHLNQQLDQSKFFTDQYILDIASDNDLWDTDRLHPSATAYKMFADAIIPKITSIL